ncbi:hypothetical protein Q5O24_12175 [Eubacteriaceae bacterium ES3]|nr:hypothetical protein Q5O24_12175 [Eubacteriaceae bacterium ES3]
MNLIVSREEQYLKEKWRRLIKKFLPEIYVLLSFILILTGFKSANIVAQDTIDDLDMQLENNSQMTVVYENLETQKMNLIYYEKLIDWLVQRDVSVSETVQTIYKQFSSDSALIRLDLTGEAIKITGQTKKQEEIVGIAEKIVKETGLSDAQILSVERLGDDTNQDLWEFIMVFE